MVVDHGGRVQQCLDSSVTHLVCMEAKGVRLQVCIHLCVSDRDCFLPCQTKYEQASIHGIPVVSADWVLDCIEQNTLLPVGNYHPSLLQHLKEEEEEEEEEGEDGLKPLLTVETVSVHTTQVRKRSVAEEEEEQLAISSCAPEISGDRGRPNGVSEPAETEMSPKVEEVVVEEKEREGISFVPVVDEPLFGGDLPTPTIPLQPEVLGRRKRTSSLAQLSDRDEVVQPETPREMEEGMVLGEKGTGGMMVGQKLDITVSKRRRESTPQILAGLVFCIVDYPQLMDSPTMDKWKEVSREGRDGGCIVSLLTPVGGGAAWWRTDGGV